MDGRRSNCASDVGWYFAANGLQYGFLYSDGVYTTLAVGANQFGTFAWGINNREQVVGSYQTQHGEFSYIYSDGVYSLFSLPGSVITQAFGINDRDQIVGTFAFVNGNTPSSGAFLYSDGTYTTLPDITLPFVPGGVPEPATWAMMLLGFAGLGFAFRQSRRKVATA